MGISNLTEKLRPAFKYLPRKYVARKQKQRMIKSQKVQWLLLIEGKRAFKREQANTEKRTNLKKIPKNLRIYKTTISLNTIEENAYMRILRSKLSAGKKQLTKLKNKHNIRVSRAEAIKTVIDDFYKALNTSNITYNNRGSNKYNKCGIWRDSWKTHTRN